MGTVVWWLEGLADMEAVEERVNVAKVEEAVVTETVQQGVREELVNTAVKFLENSRVQSSTLEMKRQLETEETELGPDLVADTIDNAVELEEKEENQSASLSNTSEIEMINPDSQENSSEDGH